MWFRHRQRVDSAFAKGLMFGKAVGKRDERDRIIESIEFYKSHCEGGPDCQICLGYEIALKIAKGEIK